MSELPRIIRAIEMYRRERGITYEQATEEAIRQYDRRGWPVPESIRRVGELHRERSLQKFGRGGSVVVTDSPNPPAIEQERPAAPAEGSRT